MHDHELSGLPPELAERIREEAAENDEIYRRRSADTLDLSRVHYFHSEMVDWAIKQMGNLKGARILDVGIGDGLTSVLMALAGAQVTGIEVSSVALARAETLAQRYNVGLNLQEMPGEDLRFEKDTFDGILCVSAYHHMDQKRAAFEFGRVLRRGAQLVAAAIFCLSRRMAPWSCTNYGRVMNRSAFENVREFSFSSRQLSGVLNHSHLSCDDYKFQGTT